ncbi:MAG TPA: cytochrome c [Gammaproteobacteria bacterium]
MFSKIVKTFLKNALTGLAFVSLASMAENLPPPVEEPPYKRQQQLRQLLLQDCSVCHGKLLQGGGIGPALTPQTLAQKSEWALTRTILRGHEKSEMPAWAWELEEYEARWLARFIRVGRISGK